MDIDHNDSGQSILAGAERIHARFKVEDFPTFSPWTGCPSAPWRVVFVLIRYIRSFWLPGFLWGRQTHDSLRNVAMIPLVGLEG
jgi:hypothetical protein